MPHDPIRDEDLLADAIEIPHDELETLEEPDELQPMELSSEPVKKQADKPMIQVFGGKRVPHDSKWSRKTNVTGTGATHVRTFFCKLRPDAIENLDEQVNHWLDAHPEYEVKFVSTSVGKLVGKNIEDALFLNIWV